MIGAALCFCHCCATVAAQAMQAEHGSKDSTKAAPSKTSTLGLTSASSVEPSKSAVFERTSSFDKLRMTVSRRKRAYKSPHFSKYGCCNISSMPQPCAEVNPLQY